MATLTASPKILPLLSLTSGAVYATARGLKVTSRGKVTPDGEFLAALPRGDARRVRKALHRAGLIRRAATRAG